MAGILFKIDPTAGGGKLAFKLVDTGAVGYLQSWQAPGGKTLDTVALADYAATVGTNDGGEFSCQVTSAALNASPNTTDETIPASFCTAEITTTNVGVTSYTLDVTGRQDPNVVDGISRYLFENDTREAYYYLSLNGVEAPTTIGRVRIIAGAIGGDANVTLTFTLSLPVSQKPDVLFGDATTSEIVTGVAGPGLETADEGVAA